VFGDRTEAGRRLAASLLHLQDEDPVVVGLPRGGVAVAFEVAQRLREPLDVIVVRKLGVPGQPEFAMGALGEGDVVVLNEAVLRSCDVSVAAFERVKARELKELNRRVEKLRGGHGPVDLTGRTVVLVDDGIATGATARAACQVARAAGAGRVVLAAPVAAADAAESLGREADEVITLRIPHRFVAVGRWYTDFTPVTDADVVKLLARARAGAPSQVDLTGVVSRKVPVR
jgi:putative phosphoribosyl transferase